MPKSAFEITDDTKNVFYHPTSKKVYCDDKNAPPLRRRTPKPTRTKSKTRSDGRLVAQ